ncbi:plexin domain containing lethal (1) G0289 [Anticarsia gemmatalis]|uniref:plexin domain containing lethal (1) G0289 n=1 Tax=Anticarsia gemmatalis TaxID=129554 RepID=UPI003F7609FD
MYRLRVHVNFKHIFGVFLLVLSVGQLSKAWNEEYTLDTGSSSPFRYDIVTLDHSRHRRDVPNNGTMAAAAPAAPATPNVTVAVPPKATVAPTENVTQASDVAVTQIPLLGVNGTGQLHVNVMGKASEPLLPDDAVFETVERIAAEHNMTNLNVTTHGFYNSSFIGNLDVFNEHWANISINKASVHAVLSNSHRRATSIQLSFDFPFYGHDIRNVTVATGGFIYTGEHVHNWLAATQYIAPLMANFDTTLTNDSVIKLYDDGEKFTAFWENVTLQEDTSKKFTFAVTLYKNGDITFAYKNIPIDVQEINDKEHPVKVGISDAYLTDKIVFYVRRKTIYEYNRVTFKNHMITNNTLMRIVALPTCLQYDTCDSCLNHNTGFNCTWCPQIQKCSSGTDRNKQDWLLRKCEKTTIVNATMCAATKSEAGEVPAAGNTAYTTDTQSASPHDTVVQTAAEEKPAPRVGESAMPAPPVEARSTIGGVVGAFLAVSLVCCAAAWILYAFKNPHTRSGQILIKYRPSQWNWRRGEARYTAATIHM